MRDAAKGNCFTISFVFFFYGAGRLTDGQTDGRTKRSTGSYFMFDHYPSSHEDINRDIVTDHLIIGISHVSAFCKT